MYIPINDPDFFLIQHFGIIFTEVIIGAKLTGLGGSVLVRFCKYRKSSGLDDVIAHGCLGEGPIPFERFGKVTKPIQLESTGCLISRFFSIQKLVLQK